MNHLNDTVSRNAVLVTGGGGYLGSILTPLLLKEKRQVKIIDQFYFGLEPVQELRTDPNITIIHEDILFQDNDPDLFNEVDTVVHLAGISNDPSCDLDPNWSIRTNFLATMALARRAKAEGIKRFIFASSCSVYGAAKDQFLDENSETGPVTLYALTKLESERELLKLSSPEFSVTILRFSTLFGLSPRMRFDLAVNVMVKRALQNQNLIVHGEGKQYRPFVHVGDAARSILSVMKTPISKVTGEIFNVGDELLNYTIADLAEEIASYFPNIQIEKNLNNNDIRSYRPKFSKMRETLQFQPEFKIAHTVKEISDAYQQGYLGSMEEEKFYTLKILKKRQTEPANSNLAVSTRWLSIAGSNG